MKQSAVDSVIAGLKAAGVSVVCYLRTRSSRSSTRRSTAIPISAPFGSPTRREGAAICGSIWLSGKLRQRW